ncbi:MAG: phosphatase PAP2 family protein [Chitinophagales bacterium]|nr:phosphatase PAP2 family protein [Chitinophagales bacterium]
MATLLKTNKWFFLPYAVLLVLAGIWLLQYSKGDFLLLLNGHHNQFWDGLFHFTNNFGEAGFYVVFLLLLLFYRINYALLGGIVLSETALVVQLLKQVVFPHVDRPYNFFQAKGISLHLVDGVTVHKHFSFPSGHTATAFAMLCLLALLLHNKWWGFPLLLCAAFGGLARIYLAQHFLVDVFFGSLIGVALALINVQWLAPREWFTTTFHLPLHHKLRKK